MAKFFINSKSTKRPVRVAYFDSPERWNPDVNHKECTTISYGLLRKKTDELVSRSRALHKRASYLEQAVTGIFNPEVSHE